jgi:uncharacterized protein (TIGR02300 family)
MPKEEWGKKRVCPTTGKRFYDLNRTPPVSPYTGQVVNIEMGRSRTMVADAEDAQTKRLKVGAEEDELLLDDEDAEDAEVALDDEVLEDDGDDEVSFEDLGDVAGDEE